MPEWEYEDVNKSGFTAFMKRIKELGKEKWELVNFVCDDLFL
jgi:hypothetical protein